MLRAAREKVKRLKEHQLKTTDAWRKAEEQAEVMRRVIESFCETVEHGAALEAARGKGGQQVGPTGEFVHVQPSVRSRLNWWVRTMRKTLKT